MHTTAAVAEVGVDERNDEYNEDLARWLQDVAHRHGSAPLGSETRPRASSDDLINYLEELTGRKYTSREDIHRFLQQLWTEEIEKERAATRRRVARETLLLGSLLAAYLHYYYWDVKLQIVSLHQVQVLVPVAGERVPGPGLKSSSQTTRT